MKRILFIVSLVALFFPSCEKVTDNNDNLFTAEITGYDQNCSTCILTFPYDLTSVRKILGNSEDDLYQTVNLSRNDFTVGQMISVKVRAAKEDEVPVCITQHQSYNFKNIYVSDYDNCHLLEYNNIIDLAYGDCLYDPEKNNFICFDSVLTDSRCPVEVFCFWAGEAISRFAFIKCDGHKISADIGVGKLDSIIGDYKFSFIDLSPYPSLENPFDRKDYVAKILIKEK
jgi:hypothetical protein